jgi:hypothetical protein
VIESMKDLVSILNLIKEHKPTTYEQFIDIISKYKKAFIIDYEQIKKKEGCCNDK